MGPTKKPGLLKGRAFECWQSNALTAAHLTYPLRKRHQRQAALDNETAV
jgi:hypothetical protein